MAIGQLPLWSKIGTDLWQDFQTHNAKSATIEAQNIDLLIRAITC